MMHRKASGEERPNSGQILGKAEGGESWLVPLPKLKAID
jgi:hypothetical protein